MKISEKKSLDISIRLESAEKKSLEISNRLEISEKKSLELSSQLKISEKKSHDFFNKFKSSDEENSQLITNYNKLVVEYRDSIAHNEEVESKFISSQETIKSQELINRQYNEANKNLEEQIKKLPLKTDFDFVQSQLLSSDRLNKELKLKIQGMQQEKMDTDDMTSGSSMIFESKVRETPENTTFFFNKSFSSTYKSKSNQNFQQSRPEQESRR